MDIQSSTGCLIKLFGDNQSNNIPEPDISTIKHVNRTNSNLEYLLNLQHTVTPQILQLNEQQALALGVIPNTNKQENTAKLTPIKVPNNAPILLKNVENKKDELLLLNPLGSCENPIEIIKDGEILHSTQNLSPEDLHQIAQALQLNVKREEQKEILENEPPNVFYRIVYPDELNLKPLPVKPLKRGRKKKQVLTEEKAEEKEVLDPPKIVKGFRTRSGRVTRPPQHITNDFKKIDTSEGDGMDMDDLKTIDFESPTKPLSNTIIQEDRLESQKRKRSISSQFRCPQCKKAYLGNNKMLQHFEKHPDHKPTSDYYKARYDNTWNYLIDISNKNPAGQRGVKFCQEVISLLNNIRIIAKTFFKNPTGLDKNLFFVDNMLSNVLGIDAGNYVLNESKLHKEVCVLYPCSNNADSVNPDVKFELKELIRDSHVPEKVNASFNETVNYNLENGSESLVNSSKSLNFDHPNHNSFNLNCDIASKSFNSELDPFDESFQKEKTNTVIIPQTQNKKTMNSDISLHTELLSDNSLLSSLPNLQNSVELILNNVNAQDSVLLDNSTSSDEVMNVDQFVNERLKNLTESDLELPNTLNLDLPALELFQFHTS